MLKKKNLLDNDDNKKYSTATYFKKNWFTQNTKMFQSIL